MRKLICFAFCSIALMAQEPRVTKIVIQAEPGTRLRPQESAVLQVKVYGELTDVQGKREGRVRQAGWNLSISPAGGGVFSKPFKYQGDDKEPILESAGSRMAAIFRQATSQFLQKDSVVYHAPAEPGKYRIEAAIGGVKGELEIEVANDAPLQAKPERWTFGRERRVSDTYRPLAEHWAPYVAQETWFDWKADAICRSDFDNDWNLGNNWENLGQGSTQAYVYYAAIESESHWFLIYNFFHARDYSDNCIAGMCHENDNEGAILTVRKDGTEMGKLEAMETLAHNNVYSYTNDPEIKSGAHSIEAKIYFHDKTHPVVFLEAGGHGALGGGDKKSFFDAERFTWKQNTGITYVYKGTAERPKHAMDREIGYELLPIYHHWWPRAQPGAAERALSAFYKYTPVGGRPGMRADTVAGSFLGVKHGADKAKPFWGWHDEATRRRKILATGQWGADPAYAVSQNLRFPAGRPVSVTYVWNPYLNAGGREEPIPAAFVASNAVEDAAAAASPATAAPVAAAPAPAANALAAADQGSCEVTVTVDGAVALMVSGAQPAIETLEGAPGVVKASTCTAAVPGTGDLDYTLEKTSGRGEVKLVNADLGRVEIRDAARGAADYRVVVRWKRRSFFAR
jgi:hypothetical protein